MKNKNNRTNKFFNIGNLNNATYNDFYNRLKQIALLQFEWINLPSGMDAEFLEETLFYYGKSAFLEHEYGIINTKCSYNGNLNIYNHPTQLNCYAINFQANKIVYYGFNNQNELPSKDTCILVKNNFEMVPTSSALDLFAYRLYNCQRTIDININAQKTPILILTTDKQKLTVINTYEQYEGNYPVIYGDKANLDPNSITSINTKAEFIADKLHQELINIWNECLTFLGINNIMINKKERLITDEANSNNDLTNINLYARLAPRIEACNLLNKKYGYKGTDKEVSVRVRTDLTKLVENYSPFNEGVE